MGGTRGPTIYDDLRTLFLTTSSPVAPSKRAPSDSSDEWFELFFDLVFAVAVGLWAEHLAKHPTVTGYATSVVQLLPIWWIWLGQTLFAARFPTDAPGARLLAIAQVIAVGVMSTELSGDPTASMRFPLGFVAARLALVALYWSICSVSANARSIAHVYMAGFGSGAAIWAVSVLVPASYRPAVWLLGLAVDFTVPWVARPILQRMPLDHRRVPSRVGAFTSLLLFVAIEGIVRGLTERGWTVWTSLVGLLSFALVVGIWWIYAARVNRNDMLWALESGQPGANLAALLAYLYSHSSIVIGVGTLSLGVRLTIEAGGPGEAATRAIGFVSTGLFLWLLGLVLIRAVAVRHRDRFWYWPFIAAVVFFPTAAAFGAVRRPIGTLAVFVVVLAVLLAMELRHGHVHASPHRF